MKNQNNDKTPHQSVNHIFFSQRSELVFSSEVLKKVVTNLCPKYHPISLRNHGYTLPQNM